MIRVVYLEPPQTALPFPDDPRRQRYFEARPGQDPLEVADGLGRPLAIVRIGSRVPDWDQQTGRFLFQSPPWVRLPQWEEPTEGPPEQAPQEETPGRVVEGSPLPAGVVR